MHSTAFHAQSVDTLPSAQTQPLTTPTGLHQEDKVSVPQTDSRNLHCLMRLLSFVVELMSKLVARYATPCATTPPLSLNHRCRRNPY
jgi:hypothetical protein